MPANIVVPELGESIVEARVVRWLKAEGDRVEAGEPVVELETDKIDVEIGATEPGVLATITRHDGDDVRIGDVLGTLDPAPAGGDSPSAPSRQERAVSASGKVEKDGKPAPAIAARETAPATPSARRLAHEHAIDLGTVHAGDDAERITRGDVETHIHERGPSASSYGLLRLRLPVPNDAKSACACRSAARPSRSASAMLTTLNEVDMSVVMATRARHKDRFRQRFGVSLGIASFFIKAACQAVKAFPRLNAEVQGDEMVLKHYYDIGVAIGAAEGLVVPVLRDADRASFGEIERQIKELVRKVEERTLTLEDLRGGTFTITNGGVFGSLMSTPILNPPQVGILGLHKIADRALPVDGKVEIRPMMYVALSYDHRIVDGLEAVRFLSLVKEFVEDPSALLFES